MALLLFYDKLRYNSTKFNILIPFNTLYRLTCLKVEYKMVR